MVSDPGNCIPILNYTDEEDDKELLKVLNEIKKISEFLTIESPLLFSS